MIETELEFLRRRTAEELDLADRSEMLVAADIHRRLAMLYASRIFEMRLAPHLEIVQPVVQPMIMTRAMAGWP
jgi:hypothetical protein